MTDESLFYVYFISHKSPRMQILLMLWKRVISIFLSALSPLLPPYVSLSLSLLFFYPFFPSCLLLFFLPFSFFLPAFFCFPSFLLTTSLPSLPPTLPPLLPFSFPHSLPFFLFKISSDSQYCSTQWQNSVVFILSQ